MHNDLVGGFRAFRSFNEDRSATAVKSLDCMENRDGPLNVTGDEGAPDEHSIAQAIGKVLRGLRKQRGLSLNDLAQISGVSSSMLSQMEKGRSIPSILVLCKIADGLDVPVAAFLKSKERERPKYLSADETPLRISADGKCAWRLLNPEKSEPKTEFYELTLRGGGIEKVAPYPQGVRANLAVSSGSLILSLGKQRHRLATGDVLEFSASISHSYINPGNAETVSFLVLCYPQRSS